ncbi:Beta-galactosidase C-terminal domain [Paenibacillus sp. FSL M8-0142]
MNHNAEAMAFDAGSANQTDLLTERPVTGHVTIPARGVMILERPAADGSEL